MKSARFGLAMCVMVIAGCGGSDAGSGNAVAGGSNNNSSVAAADVPDACTLFSKAELESEVGSELREGERRSVRDASESQCRFRRQLGQDASNIFPNPAIPSSVGITSVTISTSQADPEAVAQMRELDPDAFEEVPGLGDDAHFLGPNLLLVRVGSRAFSLRVNPEAQSPGDRAKVREIMLALARTGASRL